MIYRTSHITRLWLLLLMLAGVSLLPAVAQTIHPYGIEQMVSVSDLSLTGTPRYVGMAGAMTAVGGDPSAAKLNPAGLGIYRHSQFSLSADGTFSRFFQQDYWDKGYLYARWHLAQVSYVFALTHPERVAGVVSNNIMVSFNRRADLTCHFTLNNRNARASTNTDWLETTIDESGYRNDMNLHYAMNISNRVYWGVGVTVDWLQARQTIDRWEYTNANKRDMAQAYTLSETRRANEVGVGGAIGLLVHPVQALRLGVSLQSPTIGRLKVTDYYTEEISFPRSGSDRVIYDSPDNNWSTRLLTPLKFSAGIGLQWRNHGLLSLQYDMQYHNLVGISHTARAGLEVALSNHWLLQGGYAFSQLYTKQNVAVGLHYMGRWIRVGLAYTFGWSKGRVIDSLYLTDQGTYLTRENRVVLSFQWNH